MQAKRQMCLIVEHCPIVMWGEGGLFSCCSPQLTPQTKGSCSKWYHLPEIQYSLHCSNKADLAAKEKKSGILTVTVITQAVYYPADTQCLVQRHLKKVPSRRNLQPHARSLH